LLFASLLNTVYLDFELFLNNQKPMRLVKHPILCNYYVTYRCNATCHFCDIWQRPSPYITLENLEKNLQDLKKLGVKVIDFTGGEPLLHRQIDEILALAKKYKFITTLTTNTLLYPKLAKRIQGNVDMLHFSLDASTAEVHNKMRGVACFEAVTQSIPLALELGERPDILFTVFEDNFEEIEAVWKNICIPNNLVLILNPAFDYNGLPVAGNFTEKMYENLGKWAKRKNVYLNEAFLALRKNGGNDTKKPICKAGSSTIVISPENKLVLPCYHLGLEELAIEGNLYDLYLSQKVQKMISLEGKHEKCEGCAINCYMQPSFAVEINQYFWKALPSTFKYNYMKGTWKKLLLK
jgi:MoaA/NifB/PqqE/SkfB family radical SAM enzyme